MSTALTLIDLRAEEINIKGQGNVVTVLQEMAKAGDLWDERRHTPQQGLEFYRKYTEAMLRRFMRLSMRVGRMPSFLGQDVLRGRASTYRISSFEDAVIFVYDMGKCLQTLDDFSQKLITRVALQEHTQGEAADLLGVSLRTVVRRYGEALDDLTKILLNRRLMKIEPVCSTTYLDNTSGAGRQ